MSQHTATVDTHNHAHTPATPGLLAIKPGTAVLLRPDRSVQFGVHPRAAFVLPVPDGVDPGQVMQVMLQARGGMTAADLATTLGYCGFQPKDAHSIVEELRHAGIIRPTGQEQAIGVLRFGKPSLSLADALFAHHIRVDWLDVPTKASTARCPTIATSQGRTAQRDIALLPGGLFPPPDVQFWVHEKLLPHYPTGIMDGRLVFGPLILPGLTPCLNCIDRSYLQQDALWRSTRAQAVARPAGYSATEQPLLAELSAQIIENHLIPFRDAGLKPGALPEFLAQRHVFDPASLSFSSETPQADPECVLCRMSKVGRGLNPAG